MIPQDQLHIPPQVWLRMAHQQIRVADVCAAFTSRNQRQHEQTLRLLQSAGLPAPTWRREQRRRGYRVRITYTFEQGHWTLVDVQRIESRKLRHPLEQ